ncbi:MAG: hypothetical protein J1F11_02840 [Oscillospiraceae bacterium]|nr:hypothetical protein [Oscillospiraceae bacterium]
MDDIAEKIQSLLEDEESMNQLKELAAMFSAGMGEAASPPSAGESRDSASESPLNINPMAIMQLMSAASATDKNRELLVALKPHLQTERQQKLDRVLKLLKLYNIFTTLRENGMLNDLENIL